MPEPATLTTRFQPASCCCVPKQPRSRIDRPLTQTIHPISRELETNLYGDVRIDEALGHEREQLLLRHLALVRVQADHILQQKHVTCTNAHRWHEHRGQTLGTRRTREGSESNWRVGKELTDCEEGAGPVVVLVDDGRASSEEVDGPRPVHHLGRLGRLGQGKGLGIRLRRARRGHRRGEVGRGVGRHGVRISHAFARRDAEGREVAGTLTLGRRRGGRRRRRRRARACGVD